MPSYVTGGDFSYADAHRTFTTRELTPPAWARDQTPRPLVRTAVWGLASVGVPAVRLPGTATVLYAVDVDGAPILAHPGEPHAYVVRYHETDIVTLYRDGRVRLDNGGHPTVTTVRKMHEYTPRHVSVSGRDIIARRLNADPRIEVVVPGDPVRSLDYVKTSTTIPATEV